MTTKDQSLFCCYCGKRFSLLLRMTSDHLIPLSKGGVNNSYNKRNCCQICNATKRAYYPEHFLYLLLKKKDRLTKSTQNNRHILLYDLSIMIENTEYIVEYVQSAGDKLFIDKYHFEYYLDHRNASSGVIGRNRMQFILL